MVWKRILEWTALRRDKYHCPKGNFPPLHGEEIDTLRVWMNSFLHIKCSEHYWHAVAQLSLNMYILGRLVIFHYRMDIYLQMSFRWPDIFLLFRCKNNANNLAQSLIPKFVKLQVLSLRQNYRPQLEDIVVETVSNYCHELRDLDLSKSSKLSDHSLYALAQGCSCLTKLNISGCSGFSSSALESVARCCKNLKYLNLCGCVKAVSDKALQVWFFFLLVL